MGHPLMLHLPLPFQNDIQWHAAGPSGSTAAIVPAAGRQGRRQEALLACVRSPPANGAVMLSACSALFKLAENSISNLQARTSPAV